MSKKIRKQAKSQQKSLPILFLALAGFTILFLPLFYLPKTLDYALMPRLFALSLFLLAYIPFVFLKKNPAFDFSILRNKIFWILSGYFIITVVSIFFATNFKEGYFDIFKTFAFISLTAVLAIVFSNTKDWQIMLPKFVVVAAFIAFAIGFAQYFDKVFMSTSPLLPDGKETIYAVKGIMAHKNQYSISLMMMLPFLGFGTYQLKKGWRWASIVAFILLLIMIFLLQTRSVWVGILLSLIAAITLIALFPTKFGVSFMTRNIIVITTIIAFVAGGMFINMTGNNDPGSFYGKIHSIANTKSENNAHRLKIWKLTTLMISDQPITGVGAGNWKLHTTMYYNRHGINFEREQMNWLRPHNDFLWVFAETGIIGFLLYLSIFGIIMFYILKLFNSDIRVYQMVLTMLLFTGLICYLTVSLFSFPLERINQQAYLALLLASVVVLYHSTLENKKPLRNQRIFLYPTLLILAMGVVYSFAMIDLEYKIRNTRNAMDSSNWQAMLKEAQSLPTTFRTLDPEATPLKSYEAQAYSKLGKIHESKDVYIEALKAYPTKTNLLNNLGKAYDELGDYNMAEKLFLQALEVYPNYIQSLINLSATYYKMGEYEKTLEMLQRIPPEKRDETTERNIKAINLILKEKSEEDDF